jgi:hypothetical protein
MDRAEHLAWCKQRAIEYVDQGDLTNAFASMASDLGKHPDTADSVSVMTHLGMPLMMSGHLSTAPEMRKFIEDFN